jgi:hypothetical protein
MSNSRSARRRLNQSTVVLLGRFRAEVAQGGAGAYRASVQHDADCPGLARQSMLLCTCKPEISIVKLKS